MAFVFYGHTDIGESASSTWRLMPSVPLYTIICISCHKLWRFPCFLHRQMWKWICTMKPNQFQPTFTPCLTWGYSSESESESCCSVHGITSPPEDSSALTGHPEIKKIRELLAEEQRWQYGTELMETDIHWGVRAVRSAVPMAGESNENGGGTEHTASLLSLTHSLHTATQQTPALPVTPHHPSPVRDPNPSFVPLTPTTSLVATAPKDYIIHQLWITSRGTRQSVILMCYNKNVWH